MLVVGDNSPAVEAVVSIHELFPLVTFASQVTCNLAVLSPCSELVTDSGSLSQALFQSSSYSWESQGSGGLNGPQGNSRVRMAESERALCSTGDAEDPVQDRASFPGLCQAAACSLVQVSNCCCFSVTLGLPGD